MRHQQLQHAVTYITFRSVSSFASDHVALATTFSRDWTPIFFKKVVGPQLGAKNCMCATLRPTARRTCDGRGSTTPCSSTGVAIFYCQSFSQECRGGNQFPPVTKLVKTVFYYCTNFGAGPIRKVGESKQHNVLSYCAARQ
jgi:hypothetical protein